MSSATPPQTVEDLVERTKQTRAELEQRWGLIEAEATRMALERDRGRYQARSALRRVALALLLMALCGIVVALGPDEAISRIAGLGVAVVAMFAGPFVARLAVSLRSTDLRHREVSGAESELDRRRG